MNVWDPSWIISKPIFWQHDYFIKHKAFPQLLLCYWFHYVCYLSFVYTRSVTWARTVIAYETLECSNWLADNVKGLAYNGNKILAALKSFLKVVSKETIYCISLRGVKCYYSKKYDRRQIFFHQGDWLEIFRFQNVCIFVTLWSSLT